MYVTSYWRLMSVILALSFVLEFTACLSLLNIHVPTYVPLGTRAILSCRWQLGPKDVLYSVKWYKDGREFFRHVPKDLEPKRKFALPGVEVEESDTTGSNITLRPVSRATEGRYRCEVSGERPLFPTVSDHADMTIVVLPKDPPTILGLRPQYKVGDLVSVNCTSSKSRPETKLSWFINGEPASIQFLTKYPHQKDIDDLVVSSLKLEFILTQYHFRGSDLKLKCLATIGTIYWRSNEEGALQNERLQSLGNLKMWTHDSEGNHEQSSSSEQPAKSFCLILRHFVFSVFITQFVSTLIHK